MTNATDIWLIADVLTRLRRVLRANIRSDYPWETLPMAQVEVLQRLREEPGLGINEIATRHRLANTTVSTLIQQMVQAGLVERSVSPRDRRAVVVSLSEAGSSLLQAWQEANERFINDGLDQLPPPERTAIQKALPALVHLVAELELADRSTGDVGSVAAVDLGQRRANPGRGEPATSPSGAGSV